MLPLVLVEEKKIFQLTIMIPTDFFSFSKLCCSIIIILPYLLPTTMKIPLTNGHPNALSSELLTPAHGNIVTSQHQFTPSSAASIEYLCSKCTSHRGYRSQQCMSVCSQPVPFFPFLLRKTFHLDRAGNSEMQQEFSQLLHKGAMFPFSLPLLGRDLPIQ